MSTLALGVRRIGYEIRGYFRIGDVVFFTFLFPIFMLTLFSLIFSDQMVTPPGQEAISAAHMYLPGMIAAGILASGVQNLAVDIAMERSDGTLKRLGGTPLPPVSYFIGKIGQVFATGTLQAALLLLVASVAFGVPLPTDPSAWLTFAWVFALGLITSALLGIALSAVPRSGRSASAVVIPIVLVLQFISGIFLLNSLLPEWLQNVANVFPIAWMARGMRSVFLPEHFSAIETGGDWNLAGVAIALGAWLVIGLLLSRLTFRWIRRDA